VTWRREFWRIFIDVSEQRAASSSRVDSNTKAYYADDAGQMAAEDISLRPPGFSTI
jgi:hypothetical protein